MPDEMDASIIRSGVDLRQTGIPHSRLREVSVHVKHKLMGIDLAKNVFQVCAVNQAGLRRDRDDDAGETANPRKTA